MGRRRRNLTKGGLEMMRRNRKDVYRFTVVFPGPMERNLAAWCLKEGVSRTHVIARLVSEFLTKQNLKPDKEPRLTISY